MDGCPEGGRQPEGWWKASDGRWYPASLVRHPAARHEAGGARAASPSTPPPGEGGGRTARRVWLTWAVLLVPLVGVAGLLLVMIGLATGSRLGRIDTAGEDAAGRPGATSTVPSPTTAPAGPEGAPDGPGLPGPPAGPQGGEPASPDRGPPAGDPGRPRGRSPDPAPGGGSGPGAPPGTAAGSGHPPAPGPPGAPDPTVPAEDPAAQEVPADPAQCTDGGWAMLVDDEGNPFATMTDCWLFTTSLTG